MTGDCFEPDDFLHGPKVRGEEQEKPTVCHSGQLFVPDLSHILVILATSKPVLHYEARLHGPHGSFYDSLIQCLFSAYN
jgi:hypothetical protein